MHVFSHLGQVTQTCPKTVGAGDLNKSNPLPGVVVQDDPDKDPPPVAVETTSWFKYAAIGLAVWSGGKLAGFW